MDDRRRTISSEEQIGEALMRVSNTLEAQRLTKSLEYQEKLRRRTAFRMVLSIILAIVMVASLVVGGLLLFVLWKYLDPILTKFLPFLEMVLGDIGIIWRALVESSTYLPVFLEKTALLMDELIIMMRNMNALPLGGLLGNLNNLLATTNGLLLGTSKMLAGLSEGLKPLLAGLSDGMGVLGTMFQDLGGTLGPMLKDFAKAGSVMAAVAADSMELFAKALSQVDTDEVARAIAASINGLPTIIESTGAAMLNGSEALGKMMEALNNNADGADERIQLYQDALVNLMTELKELELPGFLKGGGLFG